MSDLRGKLEELRNLRFDAASGTDLVGMHTVNPPLGASPSEAGTVTVRAVRPDGVPLVTPDTF